MRKTETFHTDDSGFAQAMEYVQQFLIDCGLEKKALIKAKLVVEENPWHPDGAPKGR